MMPKGNSAGQQALFEAMLNEHAESILAGQPRQPDMAVLDAAARDEMRALFQLAERLGYHLTPATPSGAFLRRLKAELMEQPAQEAALLLQRWMALPEGVRVAARVGGLTLTAGITLLAVSRVVGALRFGRTRPAAAESELSLQSAS